MPRLGFIIIDELALNFKANFLFYKEFPNEKTNYFKT
jgi:hypothetical protein